MISLPDGNEILSDWLKAKFKKGAVPNTHPGSKVGLQTRFLGTTRFSVLDPLPVTSFFLFYLFIYIFNIIRPVK